MNLLVLVAPVSFTLPCELLDSVKDSWSKYDTDRLARQQAEEAQKKKRKQDEEEKSKQLQTDKKISGINDEIENWKSNISVANDLIDSAQESIKKHWMQRTLPPPSNLHSKD